MKKHEPTNLEIRIHQKSVEILETFARIEQRIIKQEMPKPEISADVLLWIVIIIMYFNRKRLFTYISAAIKSGFTPSARVKIKKSD